MKESEIKEILKKPVMDQSMDQRIADSLLNHIANIDKKNCRTSWMRKEYWFSKKALNYSLTKIAIAIFVLAIVGVGTVWAAGFDVKSYLMDIKIMTNEEIDNEEVIYPDQDKTIEIIFGTGNKMIKFPMDDNGNLIDNSGNLIEIDEAGYWVFNDGSKYLAPYIYDPNRHENDREDGNEAFAEMGYTNLIPTYLYEKYLLDETGYRYKEITLTNGVTHKSINAKFFQDYSKYSDFSESIYIDFNQSEISVQDPESIFMVDNYNDYNYIYSSYTTKGGIICSGFEIVEMNSVTFYICFDSQTKGNGILSIEFINMDMVKIREILDTIPLIEEL